MDNLSGANNHFLVRESCPVCKSKERTAIYSAGFTDPPIKTFFESFYGPQGGVEFEYLAGAEFILDECSRCGLIYQRQIPDDFLMNKLYTQWIHPEKAFQNDVKAASLEYYANCAQEIMMLVAYFNTVPADLRFLDFGMGWGRWAAMAGAFGCVSYGVEIAVEKSAYARTRGVQVISRAAIADQRFDCINIGDVLEHIPDPLETLAYLTESLKPQGLIKISVPDGADIKRRLAVHDWTTLKGLQCPLRPVAPLEHINCFTRSSLIKMADLSGLRRVKIPLGIQYRYKTDWRSTGAAVKNVLKPLYENTVKKSTYLFFARELK